MIPGFVVLWLVGRRLHLHGPTSWFLAGAFAVIVLPLLGFLWALAGFPRVGRY